eukprot:5065277-Amphidinium_carterae.1
MANFNLYWTKENLSADGCKAASEYLEIWNNWHRESVQGRPIAPIGVTAAQYAEEDRHQNFINESGLVPIHMPWIVATAVSWMKMYPCASNNVPSISRAVLEQYGRFPKEGTVDMRFYYLAKGREVGSMTVHDI